MPRASPIQTNFTGGEWSPRLEGRTDVAKYLNAAAKMQNMWPVVQGPCTRRPGTRHVAAVKDAAKTTRVIPFEFSITQAYIIEAGDTYFRFYRDNGRIESPPGTPIEIATPYLAAELFQIKWAQSADVLYLCHPNHEPRRLERTSHTTWTLTVIDFLDGPYLSVNTEATTITPSATTGAGITLTASAALFAATDVGRPVRIKHGSTWGYAKIVGFTSTTVVTADVKSNFGAITASADWRLGVWSGTTGYPAHVTFFEDRLFFGGNASTPQRVDGSRTGDHENFAPSDPDGVVVDDHAIAVNLNANNVNVARWMVDDEKGLIVGTVGGEWLIRPSQLGEALTPTNIQAKRSSTYGSADIAPIRAGRAILYCQRARRKVREHAFVFEDDGFRSPDLTLLADHITKPGLVEMAYQQEPDTTVWFVRADGRLLGMTYDREQQVVGWHQHVLGGVSDAAGAAAKCESTAVIPASDGSRDELWLIVQRRIDGATKRSIEYMVPPFATGEAQNSAFYVDSGLTYNGAPATTISGLDHLEGETVAVLVDGATHPDKTVAAGQIALDRTGSVVQVGLGYVSVLQTLNIEAGAADGTAQGKKKRIHRCVFRFLDTLGARFGPDEATLDEILFRGGADPMDAPPPLFTGDKRVRWNGGNDTKGRVTLQFDQPLPATVVAIMPQLHTQDA